MNIPLSVLRVRLAVCRLPAEAAWPDWAMEGTLLALVRTPQEVSIVCEERYVPPEVKAERGWRALRVEGPLDFSLVGILASITAPLAAAGVSIFALSTFDTDYVLVKETSLEKTRQALELAGLQVGDE